jgi:hypothetical protein
LQDLAEEAVESEELPAELQNGDDSTLLAVLQAVLKIRRNDQGGKDGIDAINEKRKLCEIEAGGYCENAAELLRERFRTRCQDHCSCRMELTVMPRWVVPFSAVVKGKILLKNQTRLAAKRAQCNGVRLCLGDVATEDIQYSMELLHNTPEQLPVLRRRLSDLSRRWEACPFDDSFRNCSEIQLQMYFVRRKLLDAYSNVVRLFRTLDCSMSNYSKCTRLVAEDINELVQERSRNERMLNRFSFLLIDPTIARVAIAFYSVLLVLSLGIFGCGIYW